MEPQPDIAFYNESLTDPGIDEGHDRNWIIEALDREGQQAGAINVVFCDDEPLLEMNIRHLGHHDYTDVITFDYTEDLDLLSGDIYISVERVSENAHRFGVSFSEELSRVMIHGVLHLIGYRDDTEADKERMRSRENYYLSLLA